MSILGRPSSRHRALAVIRNEFEHIHDTISGIKAEEKVPVPGQNVKPVGYRYLLQLQDKRFEEYLPDGGEAVSVAWLLEGIEELPKRGRRGLEKERFDDRRGGARKQADESVEVVPPTSHGQSAGAGG